MQQSVSNRVIARKLEREPKKIGRGKETLATQATVTCNRDLWNVTCKLKKPLHRYWDLRALESVYVALITNPAILLYSLWCDTAPICQFKSTVNILRRPWYHKCASQPFFVSSRNAPSHKGGAAWTQRTCPRSWLDFSFVGIRMFSVASDFCSQFWRLYIV